MSRCRRSACAAAECASLERSGCVREVFGIGTALSLSNK
jgi:hypothetical protein